MNSTPLRVLITAGPTHERIDAVRYLANRSSGRMGEALADAACEAGAEVTLLLGPTGRDPGARWRNAIRFESSEDLFRMLADAMPGHDCLIMAAAVADFRPATDHPGKIRRGDSRLTLELLPTEDLLASAAARRRPDQFIVGFALEDPQELEHSARSKLDRKKCDAIVANELSAMGSPTVTGCIYLADGRRESPPRAGPLPKDEFARWVMAVLLPMAATRRSAAEGR
ncbi:MAG: phosphopantothenoylcysteine decarboxylase [Phycisphaeraceae bacterium]|nr:phosphopantothenoylcysteine decarboxylase [Phycisphaeraceae bacterium]